MVAGEVFPFLGCVVVPLEREGTEGRWGRKREAVGADIGWLGHGCVHDGLVGEGCFECSGATLSGRAVLAVLAPTVGSEQRID